MDAICCICSESLAHSVKRVCGSECGHILHSACLLAWYKNKDKNKELMKCPVCVQQAFTNLKPLYFSDIGLKDYDIRTEETNEVMLDQLDCLPESVKILNNKIEAEITEFVEFRKANETLQKELAKLKAVTEKIKLLIHVGLQ